MISPEVNILTDSDLAAIRNAAFKRGVERGRFEQQCEAPFDTAMQVIELGCSLFCGRNGDGTHMDTDEYRTAHMAWYERARKFVQERKDAALAQSPPQSKQDGDR